MKIAVYTIAKNEQQFVERWFNSCKEADEVIIVDTGSVDKTIETVENLEAYHARLNIYKISVKPWRFEIARNFSLNLISDDVDVCICLDMDEVLVKGWRKIIEKHWKANTDRLRYNYVWSLNEDNSPGVTYHADKIHARHGFRWINPVHEVLVKDLRLGEENQVFIKTTLIEHFPDNSKSRSNYLDLLALATKEDPYNDRNAHYYARDLFFAKQYELAIEEFKRHLALPTALWSSERAASYRYMGDCYWSLNDYETAIQCFTEATKEAPNEREAYVSLAQAYRFLQNWRLVQVFCERALLIKEKPNTYINQPWAWSDWPQKMLDEAKQQQGVK